MSQDREYTFEDQHLRGTLRGEDGALRFTLEDRRRGRTWGPVPLLEAEIHHKYVRRSEPLLRYSIDRVAEHPDGLHVTVGRADYGISIGIWLRLVDGELSALVQPAELYERDAGVYRIFAVNLLPGLMRVAGDDKLLLPVGTGNLTTPGDKPALADRFLLYMEQPRWELVPVLPVCGAWDDAAGLVAVAVQGACDMECHVATDGEGAGHVGFGISLRRHWPDPKDLRLREVRYCPVPPEADPVLFAGKRLRRHAVEDCGKTTLTERAQDNPEVEYLLRCYVMKLFYGIENVGFCRTGKDTSDPITLQNYMTFAEAEQGLRKLRDAGLEQIYTQSVGWNARGHDGLYPARFPIDERFGGERGFRQLVRAGHELGYRMNVHDNFMMNVPEADNWDPDVVIQDIHGEPLLHGVWGGGPEYASWPLALPHERLGGHMERVKDLGLRGPLYVDYMFQPLEVNYHPQHKGSRADHNDGMIRVLQEGRRVFGGVQTEMGTFPAAVHADVVASWGGVGRLAYARGVDWPIKHLIGTEIPLWQLCFSGLTPAEARGGPTWGNTLTCLQYGCIPRDEWSMRPGQHPVLDDRRIRALRAEWELCCQRYGHLREQEITGWKQEGDATVSTFADGTEVTVDREKQELFVNGENIPRPADLLEKKKP